jgi:Pyruvate/2-oxoacid:ferredoxin oxidoreductase delta subunit
MCEFCLKHGEGRKWYLQAKNYSDDLLSDVRRRRMVGEFFAHPEHLVRDVERLEKMGRAPAFIRGMLQPIIARKVKKEHFGQVVPIEEVEKIFGFLGSVVRAACICRHVTLGEEKRYCYGVSLAPDGGEMAAILRGIDDSFLAGPDTSGLEAVSKEEALAAFRSYETDGLCHTVWTFRAPFIGGICNCDRSDCLAMRTTVTHNFPVMFRAEYVADAHPEKCVGCRQCMRVCQFGAITYSAATEKVSIDQLRCYGCGICRSVCKQSAIQLTDRSRVPAAANLW